MNEGVAVNGRDRWESDHKQPCKQWEGHSIHCKYAGKTKEGAFGQEVM